MQSCGASESLSRVQSCVAWPQALSISVPASVAASAAQLVLYYNARGPTADPLLHTSQSVDLVLAARLPASSGFGVIARLCTVATTNLSVASSGRSSLSDNSLTTDAAAPGMSASGGVGAVGVCTLGAPDAAGWMRISAWLRQFSQYTWNELQARDASGGGAVFYGASARTCASHSSSPHRSSLPRSNHFPRGALNDCKRPKAWVRGAFRGRS